MDPPPYQTEAKADHTCLEYHYTKLDLGQCIFPAGR